MHVIDYTKTPTEILMQMINRQNNVFLSVQDFEFSQPEVHSDPYKPDVNTSVTLTPIAGSGYYGARTIHYARNNFAEVFGSMPVDFYPVEQLTLYEILPLLNATYGINLKEDDVEDAPIPPINPLNPTAVRPVPVVAKEESYFYMGSYTFNFSPLTAPVIEDGVERLYYIYVDGLPFTEIKNSFLALKSDGVKSDSFNFLANTTALTQVLVNEVYKNSDGTFVFSGNFTLTYVGENETPVVITDAKILIISADGNVLSHEMTPRFDDALRYYGNIAVPHKYAIHDTGFESSSNLHRYGEDGVEDLSFFPEINYVPTFVRVMRDGKIYSVSPVKLMADPYNNNVPVKQIRIDRMLPNGDLDLQFNPVLIKSSNPAIDPLPLFDLVESESGGFVAAFNPLYSTDRNSAHPVVNGRAFVDENPELTTFSWNPVFRVNAIGDLEPSYKTSLLAIRDKAIYETAGSPLTVDCDALVVHDNHTVFMTYRQNPMTGYTHQQPLTFDQTGDVSFLAGRAYAEQYKWTNLRGLIRHSNGVFLGFGMMQSHMPGEAFAAAYSALARYKVDGDVDRVIWRAPIIEGSTPQVTKVFLKETVV
jgi:hypothetical protein